MNSTLHRWDKPSDCFDKNETSPQESKEKMSSTPEAKAGVVSWSLRVSGEYMVVSQNQGASI